MMNFFRFFTVVIAMVGFLSLGKEIFKISDLAFEVQKIARESSTSCDYASTGKRVIHWVQAVCGHSQLIGGPEFFLFTQVVAYATMPWAWAARPLFLGMFVFAGTIKIFIDVYVMPSQESVMKLGKIVTSCVMAVNGHYAETESSHA